ncbi:hypothetical protein TVAG_399420 [Trichomonas vaginalis G3]|uniref:Uncharacterized protein n=1 Tax=Trichomonas vaginalis (strain ATCC PRA-98 / G3) TaxID=412133 RepID=A2E5Y0_TRIV3|nr:ubiquitin protein ligase protein [Trichomonas vaginalis G3]EAY11937.1 hypothetical protein TVAG_399420 [Trichomonas vaginalis G3]KAI5530398.1 ubiquitin protein ligase protein [Trichomonas vaginalis G3]|eukprot:XP_001324160.1 hypothetical protein [Trichomonas vaginalis G3]
MTDFHMLTLEQYLTEDIGVPIDEYTKKVLYATLQEIMQSRADYLHTCEIREKTNDDINKRISKYVDYFTTVRNEISIIQIIKQDFTFSFPLKSEHLLEYFNKIIECTIGKDFIIPKIVANSFFSEYSLITPKTIEESVAYAYAQFSISDHLIDGLNKAIDSLYKIVQFDQKIKSFSHPSINIEFDPINNKAFPPLTDKEIPISYITTLMSFKIFEMSKEIISNNNYWKIDDAENQLEICVRIINSCYNDESINSIVIPSVLRAIVVYLHIYSFRDINSQSNTILLDRLIQTLISCEAFIDVESVKESFSLMVKLVPRDIYSVDFCTKILTKIPPMKLDEKNPQYVYFAIYSQDKLTDNGIISCIKYISFLNFLFGVDKSLVHFISNVFAALKDSHNIVILKALIEEMSCIANAPYMAMELIDQARINYDLLNEMFEKNQKSFSLYLTCFISKMIDNFFATDDFIPISQQILPFCEFSLKNKEQFVNIEEAKIPNLISNIYASKLDEKVMK